MKKNILLVLFISAFVFNLYSQAYTITDLNTLHDHYTFEKSRIIAIDPARYNLIEGSPYLNEKFTQGEAIINDSIRIINIPLRYNIFSDKVEFMDSLKTILEVNTTGKRFVFKFDNHNLETMEYLNRNQKEQGFLELMVDGKIKLYRKFSVKFEEATKAIGYQDPKPNRFVAHDDIFLVSIPDKKPETIFTKKDLVLKLETVLPDIETHIKDQGLKMRSVKSFVEFIQYCNSKL